MRINYDSLNVLVLLLCSTVTADFCYVLCLKITLCPHYVFVTVVLKKMLKTDKKVRLKDC